MAAEQAPWLVASGLTKAYGGVVALNSASLAIRAGEMRGLVGANGAGKSTLVKCLTGLVLPTSGEVRVDGRPLPPGRPNESLKAGIVAVPQELTVAPTMTVAENVMLGHYPHTLGRLREREMRRRTEEVLESLSLPIGTGSVVGQLPLIEQRLVMIARALSFKARLVIFDEPTATMTPLEVDLLLKAIRGLSSRNVSILYVSHRLDEIDELCNAVTVVRDGRIVAELVGDEVSHGVLVEFLTAGVRTSETARARAERTSGEGEPVLEIDRLEGERLHDISLTVRAGETLGLAGLTGSGTRETLLTLCGAVPLTGGTIKLAGRLLRSGSETFAVRAGAAYLPGDRSLAIFPTHSVRYNVSLPSLAQHTLGPFVRPESERSAVAALLDRVALRGDPERQISSLSGGNQQKAIVARWIASGARLLLLDDPTAGVDVATRPEIHGQIRALADAGAVVVLVSTDIDEIVELADRVVVMQRGRIVEEVPGAELTPARLLAAMTGQARAATAG